MAGSGPAGAWPLYTVTPPTVRDLRADTPDAARLSWRRQQGAEYRLCFAKDWAFTTYVFCDDIGTTGSWSIGVPDRDGGVWYITLQACQDGDCTEPVRAGAVGRIARDGYDAYATALPRGEGRVRVSGMARTGPAQVRYYRGAAGYGDLYDSACPMLAAGAPCAGEITVGGALAGAGVWREGMRAEAGVTLQVKDPPHIAFMFDDGTGLVSGGRYVMQDILDSYGVKGSWFLTGKAMQTYPAAVRALAAAGHRVGNHTWSHPFLTRFTDAAIAQELDQTEATYRALAPGGTLKPCFRAPNGDFNARVLGVIASHGYQQYTQTVSSMDYDRASAAQIVRNVLAGAANGATVSFHTQEPQTVIALRLLIPRLQAEGYQFVTVC